MIDVALPSIIRRWHLRDQIPIREITRSLDISRSTVRRYQQSETTNSSYAEQRSINELGKYSVQLSGRLKAKKTKSRKQRRDLKQIHEDLKELGYARVVRPRGSVCQAAEGRSNRDGQFCEQTNQ